MSNLQCCFTTQTCVAMGTLNYSMSLLHSSLLKPCCIILKGVLMKAKMLFFLLGAALMMSACTHRELYNAVQDNRRAKCDEMPDTQRAECLAQYQKSYEQYERERQRVITEPLNCAGDSVACQ